MRDIASVRSAAKSAPRSNEENYIMTHRPNVFTIAIPLVVAASAAQANVTISTNQTQNMACSQGVCAPTASSAILNVNDLESLLASGKVEVTTTGTSVEATNLVVDASVTWSSANALALVAYNTVTISEPISDTGHGGLTLTTNNGGSGGILSFGPNGNVTFATPSTKLLINGSQYKLYNTITSLAKAVGKNPAGNFAFAKTFDTGGHVYKSSPIPTDFTGNFNGLGNTIENLTINDTVAGDSVGLFSIIQAGATISHVRLTGVSISSSGAGSNVGSLAGLNDAGTLQGDSATGKFNITGTGNIGGLAGGNSGGTITNSFSDVQLAGVGGAVIGGLVGANGGTLTSSYSLSNVTVTGDVTAMQIGGLAGNDINGSIDDCYASGQIDIKFTDTTTNGSQASIGGLVGYTGGNITESYAEGLVETSGGQNDNSQTNTSIEVGGLAGSAYVGAISDSYASGDVEGGIANYTGGLVGNNAADSGGITTAYATGAVSQTQTTGTNLSVGGLVGLNSAAIQTSFATGTVSGGNGTYAGGLVGYSWASLGSNSITNSYAIGNVSAGTASWAGGLIGGNGAGTASYSYSTGTVTAGAGSDIGGFIGYDVLSGDLTDTYWDKTTSGITNKADGAGNVKDDLGIAGLTSAQLQAKLPLGFSKSIWTEQAGINSGLPFLLGNQPPARRW
jgi:hypothetical protein